MTVLRLVPAALAVLGLLVGCGGGTSPGVAKLASSHGATTTQDTPAQSAPPTAGGGGQGFGLAIKTQDGAKFAACMREHGVPNFPDPNAQGLIQVGSANGIDPASPKFQSALQACREVLPNGGQPSPQQLAKAQQNALKFSACMRSHGLKDFPDPSFTGGGVTLRLRSGAGSDLDPGSPLFQKAQTACRGIIPAKLGPGSK